VPTAVLMSDSVKLWKEQLCRGMTVQSCCGATALMSDSANCGQSNCAGKAIVQIVEEATMLKHDSVSSCADEQQCSIVDEATVLIKQQC